MDKNLKEDHLEMAGNLERFKLGPIQFFYLAILVIFIYLTIVIVMNYFSIQNYRDDKLVLTRELEATQKEIEDMEIFIENAKNPDFVEKMARENLKMVKPDEKVYIVVK